MTRYLRGVGKKSDVSNQTLFFGFSQFHLLLTNPSVAIVIFAFIAIAFITYKRGLIDRHLTTVNGTIPIMTCIDLSILAIIIFLFLRNNFINPDGLSFTNKFIYDIPLRGAHVTHDEMWELYLHSRFWFYTHQYFGWSVHFSYQVLSSFAGGVFIFLLLLYSPRLSTDHPFFAFLLFIAGGYMQLFFGDIENYTLTAVWIMGYFLASAQFIEKKNSIILPSILLAIAMTFHLLAGFLLPSLIFLYIIAWKRRQMWSLLYAITSFGLIIGITLIFFHLKGLPLQNLWFHSHAFGHDGNFMSMLVKPSLNYYWDILNLVFLLCPAWILIFPLLFYKRISMDAMNIHLLLATSSMVLSVLSWNAYLGVYNDWNLFATAALPISLLIWRNVMQIKEFKLNQLPVRILGAAFLLHSFTWIVGNRFI